MQAAVNEARGIPHGDELQRFVLGVADRGIPQGDELQRFVSAATIEENHKVTSYRGLS